MAKSKKPVIYSNYTIREKHKEYPNATVYERDFMVVSDWGSWGSNAVPFGTSPFKMVDRDFQTRSRRHKYGEWIKPDNDGSWMLSNLPVASISTSENKVILKPGNTSMLTYAYYGACLDLLESNVRYIINNYPAELYVTDTILRYFDEEKDATVLLTGDDGALLYEISNPFNIDIFSERVSDIPENANQLRYFCASKNLYSIYDCFERYAGAVNQGDGWSVVRDDVTCPKDGDRIAVVNIASDVIVGINETGKADTGTTEQSRYEREDMKIYVFYVGGEYVMGCTAKFFGYHIRPIDSEIEEFFDNLEPFGRVLLNRDSKPLYRAYLDFPQETDYGVISYKKEFIWPTTNGWNIDFDGIEYEKYIESLQKVAGYYDEYFTDNVWRSMTHEAIKQFDTFTFNTSDLEQQAVLGTGKVHEMLKIVASFYDKLKLYADNIKNSRNISYNGMDNTPDFFLSDDLALAGWEVKNTSDYLNARSVAYDLFPGKSKVYTTSDANVSFLRNLYLNSKRIFSRKGTKNGVESLLGMFGLVSKDFARHTVSGWSGMTDTEQKKFYDYSLDEYVAVAKNTSGDVIPLLETLPLEEYDTLYTNYDSEYDTSTTQGLPVRMVTFTESINGNDVEKKYVIPWYDKTLYPDGDVYFQMYGGWGKMNFREISNEDAPSITSIVSNNGKPLYDESLNYIMVVDTVENLRFLPRDILYNGFIAYVNNFTEGEYDTLPASGNSNYFILENADNYAWIGNDVDDDEQEIVGWTSIPVTDIENARNHGTSVLYLESIVDNYIGNNPHSGKDKYDDGDAFFDYFRHLFKYMEENNLLADDAYDCNNVILSGITHCGFEISGYTKDDVKVWYFSDTSRNGESTHCVHLLKPKTGTFPIYSGTTELPYDYEEDMTDDNIPEVGISAQTDMFYETELSPFNLATQEEYSTDEMAADSVLNTKRLRIVFNNNYARTERSRRYIHNVIKPYLEQMIPATAIYELYVEMGEATYNNESLLHNDIKINCEDLSNLTPEDKFNLLQQFYSVAEIRDLLYKAIISIEDVSERDRELLDLNSDGVINSADMTKLNELIGD